MMLYFGLALCYLTGLAVLLTISRKYSLAELAGYSFLIGIGIQSYFMYFLDLLSIKITAGVLTGLNLALIIALLVLNFKKLKEFELDPDPRTYLQIKNINFPAIFVACLIGFLFYSVTVKCLFWPTLEHDSVKGFDKVARIIAAEGKLKLSIYVYHLDGDDGVYAPLLSNGMAYVYLFGAEIPKIITTLFFFSTLLIFFDITRKYVGATGASLGTLLLMLTPEYFAHAALSLSNLPVAAYVGAGGLCTIAWLDKRETKFFWLGAILMGMVVWTRTDGVVFTGAVLLLMAIDLLRKRDLQRTLIYSFMVVAPFVLWNLYVKYKIGTVTARRFDFGIGFNHEHFEIVKNYTLAFLFGEAYRYNGNGGVDGAQFYGITFVLFFTVLLLNVILLGVIVYRKSDWKKAISSQMNILILFFSSLGLYCLVFYFLNEKAEGDSLWALMSSSFKRGLFCFLPLAWFYSCTSYGSTWLLQKIEKFRTGS